MNCNRRDLLLYGVTDRSWLKGRSLSSAVEEAIIGGVTFLQLREKSMSLEELVREAKDIKAVCRRYGVPLVINDSVEAAELSGADGVHIGQGDGDVTEIRRRLGSGKIIGVSAHSVEEAVLAREQGADYLGAGAVFPTGTKNNVTPLDLSVLRDICKSVDIPVVAIGGISAENAGALGGTGIAGAAVVSGIFAASDIRGAAAELREILDKTAK